MVKAFFDDLKQEYKKGFFVHVTEERQDLKLTAGYIGRYARSPPISELRIKDYTGENVTFEFKDYRNNGSKVLYTLKTLKFINNLIRHIPPDVNIRLAPLGHYRRKSQAFSIDHSPSLLSWLVVKEYLNEEGL